MPTVDADEPSGSVKPPATRAPAAPALRKLRRLKTFAPPLLIDMLVVSPPCAWSLRMAFSS